jgi:hypothetical protein
MGPPTTSDDGVIDWLKVTTTDVDAASSDPDGGVTLRTAGSGGVVFSPPQPASAKNPTDANAAALRIMVHAMPLSSLLVAAPTPWLQYSASGMGKASTEGCRGAQRTTSCRGSASWRF